MMYLLFRYHHIKPSEFFEMGMGEKTVLKAFMKYEIHEKNEMYKSLGKG